MKLSQFKEHWARNIFMEKIYRKYALKTSVIHFFFDKYHKTTNACEELQIYICIYLYICSYICHIYVTYVYVYVCMYIVNIYMLIRFSLFEIRFQFLLNLWWPAVDIQSQNGHIWTLQYFDVVVTFYTKENWKLSSNKHCMFIF